MIKIKPFEEEDERISYKKRLLANKQRRKRGRKWNNSCDFINMKN